MYGVVHAKRERKVSLLSGLYMVASRLVLYMCTCLSTSWSEHASNGAAAFGDALLRCLLHCISVPDHQSGEANFAHTQHMVESPKPDVTHRRLADSPPDAKLSALTSASCPCFMEMNSATTVFTHCKSNLK